jgi:hypothetical protein
MSDENLKREIDENEAKLEELKREEKRIESSVHEGFRDAELRNRFTEEIGSLDTAVLHERERLANDRD